MCNSLLGFLFLMEWDDRKEERGEDSNQLPLNPVLYLLFWDVKESKIFFRASKLKYNAMVTNAIYIADKWTDRTGLASLGCVSIHQKRVSMHKALLLNVSEK